MVFSSPVFMFIFLPVVLGVYLLLHPKLRNAFLLVASLFFYAWGETLYVSLMLLSVMINYLFGLAIHRWEGKGVAKWILAASVGANLAGLVAFKYANFLVDNLNRGLSLLSIAPIELGPVHLPIGISFFTFQAMSYVIDVYRKEAEVQRNPINIALYIALFPQLIAGPIVRYHDVALQLMDRKVDFSGFAYGVRRFIVGLGKKILIANTMAEIADGVFALDPQVMTPGLAWLGIIAYSLQIYFDFSGYSDMAIGLGRMFGFHFLENFNYPYISQSITEFWRRWHISLSSWYRDYLYIPLGGSRKGPVRTYINLVIVFFLCGLWHGASWSFIVWGLYHGAFLVLERYRLSYLLSKLWRPLRHGYVFLVFIVGWVFFRAETLTEALGYLGNMIGIYSGERTFLTPMAYLSNERVLALLCGLVGSAPWVPWLRSKYLAEGAPGVYPESPSGVELLLRSASAVALTSIMAAVAIRLAAGTHNPFIYFRF